jgi:FkbM family methyltransferase
MLQTHMIECVPPDQLAVLADGAVLIANMTGFRAASFSYKETSTNVTILLPEVQVPTVRVYVHPPEQDYIISRGLLTKGGWWYPHNERTRRSIVGTMLQLLAQAPPGASFFDLGGNIGTFSLPLLAAGYSGLIAEASPRNAWRLRASICALGQNATSHATLMAPLALGSSSEGTACIKAGRATNMGTMSVVDRNASGYCDGDVVLTARLDDIVFATSGAPLCSHVAVLKIDVENHELEVWRGADRFLRQCKPQHIFMEGGVAKPAAKLLMETYNYTLAGGYECNHAGCHDTHLALASESLRVERAWTVGSVDARPSG